MADKVCLAYSGGLDTSCILKWLKLKGYDVIAMVADIGQHDDMEQVRKNALATGASKVVIRDGKREFVTDFIFPALRGRAVYENRYLLGTSLARPIIAKHQVEVALAEGAKYVSHGSTGKGNDQVRFELGYWSLAPELRVIAPWKEPEFLAKFKGRSDLIRYAKEQEIDIPVTLEKPYSTDENLLHKSYESGILEDPARRPDASMFTVCVDPREAPDAETLVEVEFKDGTPVRATNKATGKSASDPLALFTLVNEVGAQNGVGRIDMVENRYVGIKSRGVYETPGGTILHTALRDLEGLTMDREVLKLRDSFSPRFAECIYNGYWFSPEMDVLRVAIDKCMEGVDGSVTLALYKGNCMAVARSSPVSLYDEKMSSMDVEGGFQQADSAGFIRTHAIRLKAAAALKRKRAAAARTR
jgi:argininosuccinate synthase